MRIPRTSTPWVTKSAEIGWPRYSQNAYTTIQPQKPKRKVVKMFDESLNFCFISSATVSSLRAEQARIAQQRKEAMKRSEELKRGVKKGVEDLMAIDTEIAHQRQVVDTIKNDIHVLNGYIHVLDSQLVVLEKELDERKMRYMKSMRYMHRNRSAQSQMVFIFSADNFNQMFRRMRFTREYASYQKAQGEAVLTTVLSNILYASSIGNGYYQRALEMCATVYAHPTLVDRKSKEHKGFMKDVKAIVDMFLEWRKGYDERVKTLEPTEKDMHQDEIADEALEIVGRE
jgi:hypothetical protein